MTGDADRDREIERRRYNQRARTILSSGTIRELGPLGAEGVSAHLRKPYQIFESHIEARAFPKASVLDICCGNGQHSFAAAKLGALTHVSDIAQANVDLAIRRAALHGWNAKGKVAAAEHQPWPDGFFDIVTCAGSLSYVDHVRFFDEVRRLLKPGGAFVCVDSLNHNPIYRVNRYYHYLRGYRSASTLRRMPRMSTIALVNSTIGPASVSFHGIFSFASPLAIPLLGGDRWRHLQDSLDSRLPLLCRFAFKFVVIARRRAEILS